MDDTDVAPRPGAGQPDLKSRLPRRRRRLIAAASRRGVRNVRVFGSLARGAGHATSDIDLLVDLEPGRTLRDLVAFRREASAILGAPVDVAGLRDLIAHEYFRIEMSRVLDIVRRDLPRLEAAVDRLLADAGV